MSLNTSSSDAEKTLVTRRTALGIGAGVGALGAVYGIIQAVPHAIRALNQWQFTSDTEAVTLGELEEVGITIDEDGFEGVTHETIQGYGGFQYRNGKVWPTEGTRHVMFDSATETAGGMFPRYIALFDQPGKVQAGRKKKKK